MTRIPGLDYLRAGPDGLRIGALTRHRTVELCRDPAVLDGFGVLPRAARWIGHYPIRARGTFGGSIAHADPAAEWCLLAVLLEANVVLTGPCGQRTVPAPEFFEGFYTTAAEPDEMITELHFPRPAPPRRADRVRPAPGGLRGGRRGRGRGPGGPARPATAALGPGRPRRRRPAAVRGAHRGLAGQPATAATWRAAGELAAAQIDPPADGHGSPAYRKKLTATLVERA